VTTILVCGGRDYSDWYRVRDTLNMLHAFVGDLRIVHGGATGADALAARWARENGHQCVAYPADWKTHGRAAGPIRNALMLEREKPDIVVAFPGGVGTADMVSKARAAGVKVGVVTEWGEASGT
jgi:hypothetical protein